MGGGILLLSQLLDEDRDGRGVRSHLLDKGVVELPLWLQTHLKRKRNLEEVCLQTPGQEVRRSHLTLVSQEVLPPGKHHVVRLLHLCESTVSRLTQTCSWNQQNIHAVFICVPQTGTLFVSRTTRTLFWTCGVRYNI